MYVAVPAEAWISTPDLPPDYRGPTQRPYVPFGDLAALSILGRLRATVTARGSAVAIIDDRGSMTFEELLGAVLRLATRITALPGYGGPVGILLSTSREYVVAVFACLAAARLSIMLDAGFPVSRNMAIIEDAGVSLLLAGADEPVARWPGIPTLPVDAAPADGCIIASHDAREPALTLDEPAFLLCTSGSSGTPKLIAHSQRTMLHWVRTLHQSMHIDAEDLFLSLSSLSALAGFVQLLGVPLSGAALRLFDIKTEGIGGLLETLTTLPVTILRGPPSLLRGIARLPDAHATFRGLRLVQTYGEALTLNDLRTLRLALPADCFVRGSYGATEASGIMWYAREDDTHDSIRVAAGILMPDTAAAILDDGGKPCARGEVGELVLRSRYNALGEWASGRLTAGRLEPDPLDPERRIYRTGDLARCDSGGVFVVLGRKDRMLNINGQRTEPAEVERVLREHAQVERAEVLAHERKGVAAMIAFVVPKAGCGAGLDATLRTELRAALPSFMVPSRLLLIDAIPLLPGGKIDTLALLALAVDPP